MKTIIRSMLAAAIFALGLGCGSGQVKDESVCTVVSEGESLEEAKVRARHDILDGCMGSTVLSSGLVVDAQMKRFVISTSTEGFVSNFEVLSIVKERPKDAVFAVKARGKANTKAVS